MSWTPQLIELSDKLKADPNFVPPTKPDECDYSDEGGGFKSLGHQLMYLEATTRWNKAHPDDKKTYTQVPDPQA